MANVFSKATQGILPFYHMISDDDVSYVKHLYSYRTVAAFERDIDYFLQHYRPIDLHELGTSISEGKGIPEKSFFLSFDDGFKELYHIVRPILLKKGVPATFFINQGFADNKQLFYRNKVSLLIDLHNNGASKYDQRAIDEIFQLHDIQGDGFKGKIKSIEYSQKSIIDNIAEVMEFDEQSWLRDHQPYLTTEQMREMKRDGFTFGGHSIDHPKYSTIEIEEQLRQTKESTDWVVSTLDLNYRVFAFPFNDDFVSQRFFDTINKNGICSLTFGTGELREDCVGSNLQRMWFENTSESPQEVIEACFVNKETRINENTDKVKRPFGGLRTYTIEELSNEVESGALWERGHMHIPITRYRAKAHTKNPRALKTDLALVSMYDDHQLIGFLGVMPDIVHIGNSPQKIGWLTCWWTHPEYGGKGIGQSILDRIYAWYGGQIGCSEFTQLGQQAAERSGKLRKHTVPGVIFHLPALEETSSWLESQELPTIEYINEIDAETSDFIQRHSSHNISNRGKEELDWILRYPWVIQAPFEDITKKRLFFSSTSKRFLNQTYKLLDASGRMIAFVLLRIRDNQMTIPYLFMDDRPETKILVGKTIAMHAASQGILQIKTFQEGLISGMEAIGFPFSSRDNVVKNAFFSFDYPYDEATFPSLQDGDGDNAFT